MSREFESYDDLFIDERTVDSLTEKKEFHVIQIPTNLGYDTYTGYIAKVQDVIVYVNGNKRKVKGLTCEFVVKEPRS